MDELKLEDYNSSKIIESASKLSRSCSPSENYIYVASLFATKAYVSLLTSFTTAGATNGTSLYYFSDAAATALNVANAVYENALNNIGSSKTKMYQEARIVKADVLNTFGKYFKEVFIR